MYLLNNGAILSSSPFTSIGIIEKSYCMMKSSSIFFCAVIYKSCLRTGNVRIVRQSQEAAPVCFMNFMWRQSLPSDNYPGFVRSVVSTGIDITIPADGKLTRPQTGAGKIPDFSDLPLPVDL